MKSHFLPFVIAFLTLIAAYVVYLDAQIKPHFSGNKWQVPAQVYARPLTFAVKEEISQKEIIDELKLLGYRRQRTVESVGEYAVGQTSVVVYRRAFDFADGLFILFKFSRLAIKSMWRRRNVSGVPFVEQFLTGMF